MASVEHVSMTVPAPNQVPEYGDLVGWGAKNLVINEDPYDKDFGYGAMAFVIDEAGTVVLEEGKAKSVFVEFHVPGFSEEA